ncbi:hypothetical protein VPNG_01794 [Cytospora leucostoma]|uniref:Uncharacterized protein n=1 Tax=Cytospora leucostoma TaxID=1230097 RepID=A0A423XJ17_9PEZI|nr:hypothetical protein VPNG_01794 [Cytospora leucostoma]
MRSAYFLIVPSILLGTVSAQRTISAPANTDGFVAIKRQEYRNQMEGRDIGETIATTMTISSRTASNASPNDSCFPQDEVVPLTVAVYFLAEEAAKRRPLQEVMGQCGMLKDNDKANTCIVVGNAAMVCHSTEHLPGCRELNDLLDDHDIGKVYGRYSNNVAQVVEDLYQLPDSHPLCRHNDGEELERCANIMQAALTCTFDKETAIRTDCDQLRGALRCHGLWVPGPFANQTVSDRRRSLSGVDSVSLQESNASDLLDAYIAGTLDHFRQEGFEETCLDPPDRDSLAACMGLLGITTHCTFNWHPACEDVADYLEQNGFRIPMIDHEHDGDKPTPALDGFNPRELQEIIKLLVEARPVGLPSPCKGMCEPDPGTGIRSSACLVCIILEN